MKRVAAVASALAAVTMLATAALFTFGGVSLVSTSGISMEPSFVAGDLAILRAASDYSVGDVATYHSDDLKTVVMHRIVEVDDGAYTFRGDNNDWLDPERPTRDQILGKLAFRVPQGGVWMDRATSFEAVGALAFLLLTAGGTTATLTRRQRRKNHSTVKTTPVPARLHGLSPALRTTAAAVAAVAVLAAVSVAVTWSTPLTSETAVAPAPATKSTVTFGYSATVDPSPVYDETVVTQPQPIFRNLSEVVDVSFVYDTEAPVDAGTVRASAELSAANGWTSSVPLMSPTDFEGARYEGKVRLLLSQLQARANAAARIIGEPAGDVTVVVMSEFTSGDESAFRAELPFNLTKTALRLAGEEPELTVSQSAPAPMAETELAPTTLSGMGLSVPVAEARWATLVLLAMALTGAVVVLALMRRERRRPESRLIQARHAQVLLAVEPMVLPTGRPVVEVSQIQTLIRLAERYGLFVMHWDRGDVHTYVVFDDATTYRYRSGAMAAPSEAVTSETPAATSV